MSTTDFHLTFEQPIFELRDQINALEASEQKTPEMRERIRSLRKQQTETTRAIYNNLDPWETVQVARHTERPKFTDYLDLVFDVVEIKKISTIIRNERVDDRDICAECNEAVCEIAPDKSSATSN